MNFGRIFINYYHLLSIVYAKHYANYFTYIISLIKSCSKLAFPQ